MFPCFSGKKCVHLWMKHDTLFNGRPVVDLKDFMSDSDTKFFRIRIHKFCFGFGSTNFDANPKKQKFSKECI
jgi:hypothetical protein